MRDPGSDTSLFHLISNLEIGNGMKHRKYNIIYGLLMLLLLLVPAFPALGEEEIGIRVSNTAIGSDGRAAVTVSLTDCGGMDSVQFDIWYDSSAVMLVDAMPGELLSGGTYAFNTDTPGTIRFAYASAEGLKEGTGTAVILTFATLQDTGTAVLVTEAKASRYDGENGAGQYRAFVTVENGGITSAGSGLVPDAGITPWIPETPTPSPKPTPAPTETPAEQTPQVTQEEIPEKTSSPIMGLAYLFGALAVIACAGAVWILLSGRKERN